MENCLKIEHLTKVYSKSSKPALDDFSYTFNNGVYGLLGPNGAGKSTLNNLIVQNLNPTKGSIVYNGTEIFKLGAEYRSVIGFMPQQQQLYDTFTARQFLWYFCALKGLNHAQAKKKVAEILKVVGLEDSADKRLGSFSGGMKQRAMIGQALLGDPQILILDEPTVGLDPKERMRFRNFIYSISQDRIVIFATHVISDIELIAREIIFLRKGQKILTGTVDEILHHIKGQIWEIQIPKTEYEALIKQYPQNRMIGERENMIYVKVIAEEKPDYETANAAAVSLEDAYLYLYP